MAISDQLESAETLDRGDQIARKMSNKKTQCGTCANTEAKMGIGAELDTPMVINVNGLSPRVHTICARPNEYVKIRAHIATPHDLNDQTIARSQRTG